jgi:hypothetical protein
MTNSLQINSLSQIFITMRLIKIYGYSRNGRPVNYRVISTKETSLAVTQIRGKSDGNTDNNKISTGNVGHI